MLQRIDELSRTGQHFAFESTLAGRSAHRLLTELIALGYDVHIFYLWLPSPDMSVARVRRRVESGGHNVAESVVRRRFWKSLINFDRFYRPLAATWRLYDGSAPGVRPLIARGVLGSGPLILDEPVWLEIRKRIEEHS